MLGEAKLIGILNNGNLHDEIISETQLMLFTVEDQTQPRAAAIYHSALFIKDHSG